MLLFCCSYILFHYLLCSCCLIHIQQANQTILPPCCMETLLSVCISSAPISFLLTVPQLWKTCGAYLDDCVSLCFVGK